MKRIKPGARDRKIDTVFLFFLLILLLWSVSAGLSFAAMVGDPLPLGKAGFSSVSLEYDQTERKMDSATSRYAGTLRSDRLLLRADYGLSNRTDLFLWLGGGDAEAAQRIFSGAMGIAFGGGGRWKLLQLGDLQIGAGLQVLQLFSRDSDALAPKLSLSEFEADLGAALSGLSFFRPYGGLRLTQAQGKFWGGETARVRSPHWVGLFLGGEFRIWKGFWFGAEGRLINEYSAAVRLSFRP